MIGDLLESPLEHVTGIALIGGAVGIHDVTEHPRDRRSEGRQGRIWNVVGSGIAIISLSSIRHKKVHEPTGCVAEKFYNPLIAWKIAGLPHPEEPVISLLEAGQSPG